MKSLCRPRPALLAGLVVSLSLLLLPGCAQERDASQTADTTATTPDASALSGSDVETDVPYVPTPQNVVERMLEIANVTEDDVVYDLGSGDGRFVITAAEQFGARGVGIDINPQRIQEARKNAKEAGVTDMVEFQQGDLFDADLSEATVVTLYLLPDINIKLRPKLFEELDPGDRVVSHDFDMDEWEPDRTETVDGNTIYFWTIPETVPDNLKSN